VIDLSIVVVNYNNFRVLRGCLPALVEAIHGINAEVIVSDNGSTDGSLEWIRCAFLQFRLVENGANLGFAEANNRAFECATGRCILLLNPDTMVLGDAIGAMMRFLEQRPRVGAVGCKLLNGDGSRQISARSFPTLTTFAMDLTGLAWRRPRSRLCGRFNMTYWNGETARSVDWVSGAALMFRREILQNVGYVDPWFFLTYDDIDFCRRIKDAGYEVWYTPEGQIVHLDRQSEPQSNPRPEARIKYLTVERNSRVRYFVKHHGRVYALCVELLHFALAAAFLSKAGVFGTKQSPEAVMEKRLLLRLNWATVFRLPRVCWDRLRRSLFRTLPGSPTPLFINPYLANE
jgi:hypothetical protein